MADRGGCGVAVAAREYCTCQRFERRCAVLELPPDGVDAAIEQEIKPCVCGHSIVHHFELPH